MGWRDCSRPALSTSKYTPGPPKEPAGWGEGGGRTPAHWPGAHCRAHLGRRLPKKRSVVHAAGAVGPGSKVLHFGAASLVPSTSKASPHQLAKSGRPALTAHAWPRPWSGREIPTGRPSLPGASAAPPQPRHPHLQRLPQEVKGNKQRLAAAPVRSRRPPISARLNGEKVFPVLVPRAAGE